MMIDVAEVEVGRPGSVVDVYSERQGALEDDTRTTGTGQHCNETLIWKVWFWCLKEFSSIGIKFWKVVRESILIYSNEERQRRDT